ncbi:unnamed protein product [Sphacelaria rigidula]
MSKNLMSNRIFQVGALTLICGTYVSVVAFDRFGTHNHAAFLKAQQRGRERGEARFRAMQAEEDKAAAAAAAADAMVDMRAHERKR